jgi:hypothetical protein
MTASTTGKPKAPPAEHHIQFALVDPAFAPVKEPRKYKMAWLNNGEKAITEQVGTTNADGLTALVKTKGKVPVTLEISPPDGSDCKVIGTASSRSLDKKPSVRVQLKATAEVTSAPKPSNKCETIDIREGKQQIRYVIKHVTGNGNKLENLPYLVVDAEKMEVLSDGAKLDETARRFSGGSGQVATETINCDGVAKVGLVLGNATDDPTRWKDKQRRLVMFETKPRDSGLTTVVITEMPVPGEADEAAATPVSESFTATMTGGSWAHFSRAFTLEDVKQWLPGGLRVCTSHPTDTQLGYAVSKRFISTEQQQAYVAARKAPSKDLPPLEYDCAWTELLEPIYSGRFTEPAAPENKLVPKIDPATKKKVIDPATKQPVMVPQYSETEFERKTNGYRDAIQEGQGAIRIEPLGLTITLDASATRNARQATGLTKQQILCRTHPYAYVVLLEGAATLPFHAVTLSSTWRPQLGSVLHKLGDAIDLTTLDCETDQLAVYSYKGSVVNALAKQFADFIANHRYARADRMYYSGDTYNTGTDSDNRHDDHLHFTVDRLRPPAEQDRRPLSAAPSSTAER